MKFFTSSRMRVEKDIVVRICRNLRGQGKINAQVGQEVLPDEILGSGQVSSGFRILNLSNLLSVSPKEVEKYLKRDLGQKIYKDELLALKSGGLLGGKKIVTAPTDGVLDFLNPSTGELRMSFLPKKVDLPAGVYGIIEEVDQIRGQVVIRTEVSRVFGMFGSGRGRDGILHMLGKRDEIIDKSHVLSKPSESILAGGSVMFKDAISAAISGGVNGLITGGINAKDYKAMVGGRIAFPRKLENDIGISIVVCEGFGSIPLGEDIYEVLSAYEGKFISIDGNSGVINLPSFDSGSIIRVRKTTLPKALDDLNNNRQGRVTELRVGAMVRIIGNSYPGEQGKLIALDQTETTLISGIKTFLATVETKRKVIQVPVANCEVMEYIH